MLQSSGLARRGRVWLCAAAMLLLAACDRPAVAPAAPPPSEVGVLKVEPRTQPLTFEVIGEIRAYQEVELRPRVSGVVEKQLFRPGQMVREGAPLFVIDTRSLDSAALPTPSRGRLEAEAALAAGAPGRRRATSRCWRTTRFHARPTSRRCRPSSRRCRWSSRGARRSTAPRIDRSFAEVQRAGHRARSACRGGGRRPGHRPARPCWPRCQRWTPCRLFQHRRIDYVAFSRRLMPPARSRPGTAATPSQLILADGTPTTSWAGSTSPTAPSTRPPAR